MRIAIASSGRFHVCDLARELALLGHEVKFYSVVPPWRTRKFGLPKECNRWMLPRMPLRAALTKIASYQKSQTRKTEKFIETLDNSIASCLEPCDVFIGMSGLCSKAAGAAKEKFGADIWIERGSRHILSQCEILAAIPGASGVSEFTIERELADYERANRIVVLSNHCLESFLERGIDTSKMFCNPLGVNLRMFAPTPVPTGPPTIIMTGAWSLRKGCNVLLDAWRKLRGIQLLHVGPLGDCPLPTDENFTHHDKVDQSKLVDFYARSHVFALASHEEGLATVQPQALACGLRLVCTSRTGGEDLIPFTNSPCAISVVPPNDSNALSIALQQAMKLSLAESGLRNRLADHSRDELSWSGYGRRYSAELNASVSKSPKVLSKPI